MALSMKCQCLLNEAFNLHRHFSSFVVRRLLCTTAIRYKKKPHPEEGLAKVMQDTLNLDKTNGFIYDKKPFRVELEPGKKYAWCRCGYSKKQPFCDGTHKAYKDHFGTPNFVPVRFEVEEKKEYFLCNCKQTNNRPFCDGTHRSEAVQQKRR